MSRLTSKIWSLTGAVAPRLAARVDHHRLGLRNSWGGPFNGQFFRQQLVERLLEIFPFEAVVETGTFRGTTTEFLAEKSRLPVWTVEVRPHFYHYSRLRLRSWPNVRLFRGDSREFLRGLASNPSFPKEFVLFYLDAHWEEDLPLREEMHLINRAWSRSIVLVDDFKVSHDPDYAFDDYGLGRALTLEYLRPDNLTGLSVFWPSTPGRQETGKRRGCAVFAHEELSAQLDRETLLRKDS